MKTEAHGSTNPNSECLLMSFQQSVNLFNLFMQKLKETAKHMEWSLYISTQRLRWLGHALRLPEDSPVKQALYEIEKPTKRTVGRPKLKWIDIVKNQLSKLKITWEETKELSQNRVGWREVVDRWKRMQNATSSCEN